MPEINGLYISSKRYALPHEVMEDAYLARCPFFLCEGCVYCVPRKVGNFLGSGKHRFNELKPTSLPKEAFLR